MLLCIKLKVISLKHFSSCIRFDKNLCMRQRNKAAKSGCESELLPNNNPVCCNLVNVMWYLFTQQQIDQDLLTSQSVAPCQTYDSANDPRDAVPRER